MFGPQREDKEEAKGDDDDEDDGDHVDPKYKEFLFAPDDLPELLATPKDNQCGIGYKGLDRNALLGGQFGGGAASAGQHINLFEPTPASSGRGRGRAGGGGGPQKKKGRTGLQAPNCAHIYRVLLESSKIRHILYGIS